jgi:hypothetical protein
MGVLQATITPDGVALAAPMSPDVVMLPASGLDGGCLAYCPRTRATDGATLLLLGGRDPAPVRKGPGRAGADGGLDTTAPSFHSSATSFRLASVSPSI